MRINIKTKNFSLTPSIETYLRGKLDSLDKILPYNDGIFADVELARTTRHHQKGDIFRAEVNLTVSGKLIRSVAEQWDLRVAIDTMRDELWRKITGNKEKRTSLYKRGARMLKKLLRGS